MTRFVGYVVEQKTWNDDNGEVRTIDRVRINVTDDKKPNCVGTDVGYHMVKKEDFPSIFPGLREYDDLKAYIGSICVVNLGVDVRTQKVSLNSIEFIQQ